MMKHFKCSACHHEWDMRQDGCDWCGAPGIGLDDPWTERQWTGIFSALTDNDWPSWLHSDE
jgi:hypothetical protein